MIKKKDITIVVQGPYFENITKKVLNNISQKFKSSEIIFSTYKNQKIPNNVKKKFFIIYNDIPLKYKNPVKSEYFYNYYGQIRTSLNGIKKSKKKYVLKVRSDMFFNNTNFLNYFDKFKYAVNKNKILSKKIIISSHYTIDPRKNPLPFHFSDWFFFGLKSDMLKVFNQNYISSENQKVPLWFYKKNKPKFFFNNYVSKFRVEQNIIINFLKKYIKLNLKHGYDHNKKNIILTEKILVSNFIVLNPNLISFESIRHPNFTDNQELIYFCELITHEKWLNIYKKYCLISFRTNKLIFSKIFKTFLWIMLNPKEAAYKIYQFRKYNLF